MHSSLRVTPSKRQPLTGKKASKIKTDLEVLQSENQDYLSNMKQISNYIEQVLIANDQLVKGILDHRKLIDAKKDLLSEIQKDILEFRERHAEQSHRYSKYKNQVELLSGNKRKDQLSQEINQLSEELAGMSDTSIRYHDQYDLDQQSIKTLKESYQQLCELRGTNDKLHSDAKKAVLDLEESKNDPKIKKSLQIINKKMDAISKKQKELEQRKKVSSFNESNTQFYDDTETIIASALPYLQELDKALRLRSESNLSTASKVLSDMEPTLSEIPEIVPIDGVPIPSDKAPAPRPMTSLSLSKSGSPLREKVKRPMSSAAVVPPLDLEKISSTTQGQPVIVTPQLGSVVSSRQRKVVMPPRPGFDSSSVLQSARMVSSSLAKRAVPVLMSLPPIGLNDSGSMSDDEDSKTTDQTSKDKSSMNAQDSNPSNAKERHLSNDPKTRKDDGSSEIRKRGHNSTEDAALGEKVIVTPRGTSNKSEPDSIRKKKDAKTPTRESKPRKEEEKRHKRKNIEQPNKEEESISESQKLADRLQKALQLQISGQQTTDQEGDSQNKPSATQGEQKCRSQAGDEASTEENAGINGKKKQSKKDDPSSEKKVSKRKSDEKQQSSNDVTSKRGKATKTDDSSLKGAHKSQRKDNQEYSGDDQLSRGGKSDEGNMKPSIDRKRAHKSQRKENEEYSSDDESLGRKRAHKSQRKENEEYSSDDEQDQKSKKGKSGQLDENRNHPGDKRAHKSQRKGNDDGSEQMNSKGRVKRRKRSSSSSSSSSSDIEYEHSSSDDGEDFKKHLIVRSFQPFSSRQESVRERGVGQQQEETKGKSSDISGLVIDDDNDIIVFNSSPIKKAPEDPEEEPFHQVSADFLLDNIRQKASAHFSATGRSSSQGAVLQGPYETQPVSGLFIAQDRSKSPLGRNQWAAGLLSQSISRDLSLGQLRLQVDEARRTLSQLNEEILTLELDSINCKHRQIKRGLKLEEVATYYVSAPLPPPPKTRCSSQSGQTKLSNAQYTRVLAKIEQNKTEIKARSLSNERVVKMMSDIPALEQSLKQMQMCNARLIKIETEYEGRTHLVGSKAIPLEMRTRFRYEDKLKEKKLMLDQVDAQLAEVLYTKNELKSSIEAERKEQNKLKRRIERTRSAEPPNVERLEQTMTGYLEFETKGNEMMKNYQIAEQNIDQAISDRTDKTLPSVSENLNQSVEFLKEQVVAKKERVCSFIRMKSGITGIDEIHEIEKEVGKWEEQNELLDVRKRNAIETIRKARPVLAEIGMPLGKDPRLVRNSK